MGPRVTTLVLHLGTLIDCESLLLTCNAITKQKPLTGVDTEHVNCTGNSMFDFDFFLIDSILLSYSPVA